MKKTILAIAMGLIIFACSDMERDNPTDPKSDNYEPPVSIDETCKFNESKFNDGCKFN
ncbi:MAG: hypothetical protein OEZ13_09405 [Spirochaetia bacterium]|nr:hypothetical protein [Spirochaetia bacterium]